jgi:hypothetical protein
MPFQDRIAHAAAVAKWKADQQMRLFKSQNRIGEIETQIRAEKAALADKTLALYAQDQLVEDELKTICAGIASLHELVREQQSLQEAIRNERPPEQASSSATYPPVQSETLSGLICPQCNRPLVGRFCPDHGVEGISPTQSAEPVPATDADASLVCPTCGKVLTVRFCPEHGLEGVPQSKS